MFQSDYTIFHMLHGGCAPIHTHTAPDNNNNNTGDYVYYHFNIMERIGQIQHNGERLDCLHCIQNKTLQLPALQANLLSFL